MNDDEEDTAQGREEEDAYIEEEDLPEEGSHSSQPPSIEWSDEIIVTDIGQEETNRGTHLRHYRDRSGLSFDSPSLHTEKASPLPPPPPGAWPPPSAGQSRLPLSCPARGCGAGLHCLDSAPPVG